tara:strand:- start:1013 stop:1309 length:297 start_codon:yes stop_codon:yes gene_type:complete
MHLQTFSEHVSSIHPYIYNSIGIYGVWIFVHYGAAHLYASTCNRFTVVGFFSSPILSTTPYCKSLNWLITKGSETIDTMWITIGTWASGYLLNKAFFK